MLSWLEALGLKWLSSKVVKVAVSLWGSLMLYLSMQKTQNANKNQAAIVDALAKQIMALLKAGKPVPIELKEKLREESRKLISTHAAASTLELRDDTRIKRTRRNRMRNNR